MAATGKQVRPIRMRRVQFGRARRPGDFYWHDAASGERRLYVMLPGGGGGSSWVHSPATGGWDGDEDRPTYQGCIHAAYGNGAWRGYIRNGFLVPA